MTVATGKIVTLHARWTGDPPVAGDYMRSQGAHTRFAYRIVEVTPNGSRLDLRCEQTGAWEVPEGARVHVWKWDRRSPTKGLVWT